MGAQHFENLGWEVQKVGWPDFICYGQGGKIILVEVKPRAGSYGRLNSNQERVLKALAAYGVPCFRWDPEAGLVQIKAEVVKI
jgi:hypothetical protein